jgi:hypothetical protein
MTILWRLASVDTTREIIRILQKINVFKKNKFTPMKHFLFLFTLCCLFSTSYSQSYLSHFSLEGQAQDPTVSKYDILPNGNIIVTAIVDTNAVFFPGNNTIYQETGVKNPGSIVTCISPNNTVLWTKKWIPENYLNDFMYIYNTIHDAAGNIYLGARYVGKFDVDPGAAVNYFQPDSLNSAEACIIKLDANGQFLWAKKIGDTTGVNSIYIQDMKWLPNGHLSLIGDFNGTLDFDPGVNSVVLNSGSPYTRHGYIAEYDASGNFIDVKQLKGDWCSVFSMYTDSNNLHYVMYYYDDTLNLSFNTTTNQKIATGEYGNRGLAKFDANYNLLWNKDLDTNLFVRSIVPVNSSSFYVMSNFYGTTTLNNGLNTSSVGFSDIAVDKWDQNGNVQWTKVVNGAGANEGLDLKMFDNHLYLLYTNEDSTHFSTGIPSAIHSDNINMALSLFDNSFQHISTATFDSDSSNYTFNSELLFDGSQALFKMYITGQTEVDPTPLSQLVSPAYGNNNPAVMVRLNATTLTSVNSLSSVAPLHIYPNPTHDALTVDSQERDYTVSVCNFLGQELIKRNYKSTNRSIDVHHLSDGIYTISLISNGKLLSTTFEKK